MIKTIQLLKESFLTYKANFKNIFNMAWPIALLTMITQYYGFFLDTAVRQINIRPVDIVYIIIGFLLSLFSSLAVGLFLVPALSRSIQKNEDNGVFNVKEGYIFQKKNIWKFVMVNLWGLVYILKRLLPYILISILAYYMLTIFADSPVSIAIYTFLAFIVETVAKLVNYSYEIEAMGIVYLSLFGLIIGVGIVLNITRFIVYKSVFFSKDNISPKDAVKESMNLGVIKMKDMWKIILAMLILTISMEILMSAFTSLPFGDLYNLIITSIIMIIFSMPYMLIVVSKGYVKIRGDVAPVEKVEVV